MASIDVTESQTAPLSRLDSRPGRLPELARARAWIVTDGKAGDENQCVGIAETLGLAFETRKVPAPARARAGAPAPCRAPTPTS